MNSIDRFDVFIGLGALLVVAALFLAFGLAAALGTLGVLLLVVGLAGSVVNATQGRG